jgi:hypothetical protein
MFVASTAEHTADTIVAGDKFVSSIPHHGQRVGSELRLGADVDPKATALTYIADRDDWVHRPRISPARLQSLYAAYIKRVADPMPFEEWLLSPLHAASGYHSHAMIGGASTYIPLLPWTHPGGFLRFPPARTPGLLGGHVRTDVTASLVKTLRFEPPHCLATAGYPFTLVREWAAWVESQEEGIIDRMVVTFLKLWSRRCASSFGRPSPFRASGYPAMRVNAVTPEYLSRLWESIAQGSVSRVARRDTKFGQGFERKLSLVWMLLSSTSRLAGLASSSRAGPSPAPTAVSRSLACPSRSASISPLAYALQYVSREGSMVPGLVLTAAKAGLMIHLWIRRTGLVGEGRNPGAFGPRRGELRFRQVELLSSRRWNAGIFPSARAPRLPIMVAPRGFALPCPASGGAWGVGAESAILVCGGRLTLGLSALINSCFYSILQWENAPVRYRNIFSLYIGSARLFFGVRRGEARGEIRGYSVFIESDTRPSAALPRSSPILARWGFAGKFMKGKQDGIDTPVSLLSR